MNSGIEWIGQIPDGIKLYRLKYLTSLEKGKLPKSTNNDCVGKLYIGASEMNGKGGNTYSTDNLPLCKKDDILILWDGANAGLIATGLEGIVSSTVVRMRSNEDFVCKKFLFYLMKYAESYFRDKVNGTTIPHMSTDYIDDIPFIMFNKETQQKIASYLDKKCLKIDNLISINEGMIEKLKEYKQSIITEAVTHGLDKNVVMKDSGVEWIGDIPNYWNTCYLSIIFYEHKLKNKGMINTNLLSLSYGNIIQKDINTNDGLLPASFKDYNIISEGDIVLRLTDLQNDHKSLRTGLCLQNGIITSAYLTLRSRINIDVRYMHYLLHTFDIKKGFYGMGNGVRQGLNFDGIRHIVLVCPPIIEQHKISDHLDKKCGNIDKLIKLKQQKIEKLQEYKKSLIYEYVTGKKQVI